MDAKYRVCKLNDLYLENEFKYINLLTLGVVRVILPCGVIETPYKPYKSELWKLKNEDVVCLDKPDGKLQANFLDEPRCLEIIKRKKVTLVNNT